MQPQEQAPQEQAPQEDKLLTTGEVARRLRVDGTTVRRWIKQGALEAVPLPHIGEERCTYRVWESTLEAVLNPPASSGKNAHHPTTSHQHTPGQPRQRDLLAEYHQARRS